MDMADKWSYTRMSVLMALVFGGLIFYRQFLNKFDVSRILHEFLQKESI